MGQSWGHTLCPFTDEEIAVRDRWTFRWVAEHGSLPDRPDYDAAGRRLCSASGKCREPARWWGTYCYVTGRAGRMSTARKALCDGHAERWRREYGAAERGGQGRPATATEQAVHQLLGGTAGGGPFSPAQAWKGRR